MSRNRLPECVPALMRAGISYDDALALRRISMALHTWHELECGTECGTECGAIERDETTGEVYWYDALGRGKRYSVRDREAGALKRLGRLMVKYPTLSAYVQSDPRGCSLYILRPGDVREGETADNCYSRGLAVYK